jgi:hypothetical protein
MKDPSRMKPYTYASDRKYLKSYAVEVAEERFNKKARKHLSKTV